MTTDVSESSINLDPTLEILREVARQLGAVNGTWPGGENSRAFRSNQAELTRVLLNMSDQLSLASSLVKNEYWNVKGLTSYEL